MVYAKPRSLAKETRIGHTLKKKGKHTAVFVFLKKTRRF